ncbi:DUF3275 family protein [bacterium endosymbiont of Bathymodiolus sp. 5 South]|jgi:hypothetical protein|uniref:DUF3275 family protein n=1 Tax=bacterium endosymbiont of Bathymodiolus sp. 5 South TaxID=1181670 RepID=UPI0010B37996|nr:DUF3275 family protein [bacterium endosymbiont of Bathymodiolus sp. 5 South]VVH58957.1 hypothetical protein BSPCLSOX_2784 [uncultured Gammaproteobacteria bacterium]SSC09311.1 FIG034376: Hypothetical protein [bacterium endosymbiont of Bathymodiolus sp. 5 South]VVH62774.1 hypothetical protein BSPWISOX_123 [uncultured Gammaproteobacteria bacterium]VVM25665.1 hypothetical protein BSPWISOXPB_7701 [uncultured Gammaproteobacteria bacterium]VVM27261.1 hypothetical protein BSPWISOXPB_4116 [unculture
MYKFKGTLLVRKIFGKYGEFAIGSIQTPIGQFSVKQSELDEYEEGTYEGRFVISKIQTVSGGFGSNKLILESRATLDKIHIDEIDEAPVEVITEADPITEDSNIDFEKVEASAKSNSKEDLHNLFNEQEIATIEQGEQVTLDPTSNRGVFRQQKNYLKSNDWKFNMQEQAWYLP